MEIIKTSDPFKVGYLQIPPQGFLKKSWSKKYYALFEASEDGVQRLEVFDNEENFYRKSSNKIIPLTDCVKVTTVTQKHQSNLFEVVTKNTTFLFSADSHQEMNDWVSSFRNVAFGSNSTLKTASLTFNSTDSNLSSCSSSINEENMIYSSVDAPEVYVVKVGDCESKTRLKLNSTYHLLITSVGISLSEIGVSGVSLTWAYRHIRRYGYSNDTFSFEAGRKSLSGEGLFVFETKAGAAIFQSTASHVNLLKSSRNENDLLQTSSPVDDQKAFFSDTLSKTQHSTYLQISNEKVRNQLKPPAPVAKPPRKPKPSTSDSPSSETYHTYEDPGFLKGNKKSGDFVYDFPEERSDAWKTLGCDVDDAYESDTSNDPGYECVTVNRKKEQGLRRDSTASISAKISVDSLSHTYAKVKAKYPEKLSSFQPLSESNGNTDKSEECGSPYENVRVEVQPSHFIFNDSEYAEVIRKKNEV